MELRLCNRLVMSTGTGVCPVRLFASCHLRQCTAIDIKPVIHRWGACALGTTRVARGSMIPENIVPPTNFLLIVARQKTGVMFGLYPSQKFVPTLKTKQRKKFTNSLPIV